MPETIQRLAEAFQQAGGRALLVGGTVRDRLLGLPVKDYDLEVFGLPLEQLRSVSQQFGPVQDVGKAFGILKLKVGDLEIDVAAPRQEQKVGRGHAGFSIAIDPALTPSQAARRRDFTINAIAEDPLTGEIIDPYHGQSDLAARVLRVVDPTTFIEDPLRVLRAVQLAGRFGLHIEIGSLSLLQSMRSTLDELSRDRVRAEWTKLFLLSTSPSVGLELAKSIGLFTDHPIEQLASAPIDSQDQHTQWSKTLEETDRAAALARQEFPSMFDRLVILLATFFSRLGEAIAPRQSDRVIVGIPVMQGWLETRGFPSQVIRNAAALLSGYATLRTLQTLPESQLHDGRFRSLVNTTAPGTIPQLISIVKAKNESPAFIDGQVLPRLHQLGLTRGPVPVLNGHDLLQQGWPASPRFGQLLRLSERYAEASGCSRLDLLHLLQASPSLEAAYEKLQVMLSAATTAATDAIHAASPSRVD